MAHKFTTEQLEAQLEQMDSSMLNLLHEIEDAYIDLGALIADNNINIARIDKLLNQLSIQIKAYNEYNKLFKQISKQLKKRT